MTLTEKFMWFSIACLVLCLVSFIFSFLASKRDIVTKKNAIKIAIASFFAILLFYILVFFSIIPAA